MQNSQPSSELVSQDQIPYPINNSSLEEYNSIPENIIPNQEDLGSRDFESDYQSQRAQTSPLIRNNVDRHGYMEGYLVKQNLEKNQFYRKYQPARNQGNGQVFDSAGASKNIFGQTSSQKYVQAYKYARRNTSLARIKRDSLQQRGKPIEYEANPYQPYNISKGNYYKPELGLKKYSRVNGVMACQRQTSLKKNTNNNKNQQHFSDKLNPKKVEVPVQHQKFQDLELKTQTKYNFEQFFSKCMCQVKEFTCPRGHQARYVCASKQCHQNSNICVERDCKGSQQHKECTLKLPIQMFVDQLNKNLERQKPIAFEMYYFQEKIIKMIEKNRRILTKRLCFQGIGSQQNEDNHDWRSESRELLSSSKILQTIDQFYAQKKYDGKRLEAIQKYLKDEKTNVCKVLQKTSAMLLKKYNQEQLTHIPSHLVLKKQEVQFILEQLNFPKEVTLLFRASENEFSLPKYHKICSQEDHTLTIIKTEHQKLIGAYTPIKLTTKLGRDKSNKTFLMSIDLKERLDHISNGESAIHYDTQLGPCFGGFYNKRDIQVFQQNGVLFCITDFPSTFNWKKHMLPNQESYRFLTGVCNGKRCRVIDFEVFKIGFRE